MALKQSPYFIAYIKALLLEGILNSYGYHPHHCFSLVLGLAIMVFGNVWALPQYFLMLVTNNGNWLQ